MNAVNALVSVTIAAIGAAGIAGAEAVTPHASQSHGFLGFFFDEVSHVLVGALAATAGVLAHRAWARRRWRSAPAGSIVEAVLVVDMVDSTLIATKHGDSLAMRARNLLERRTREAASGVSFVEYTGDGCLMTFPSVALAVGAATTLLDGLIARPPNIAPGPVLEVRCAVTYGEILLDARGARHGAVMNKAFRLMSVTQDAFVHVDGESQIVPIPDRNRIFLDEDAVNQLAPGTLHARQAGICRLKGFAGFHRVYALHLGDRQAPAVRPSAGGEECRNE